MSFYLKTAAGGKYSLPYSRTNNGSAQHILNETRAGLWVKKWTKRICFIMDRLMVGTNPNPSQRILIIHNPVAGTSDPEQVVSVLSEKLDRAGVDFHIHQTSKDDNIRELVTKALDQDFSSIWAAGGDGTVSGVAGALIHRDVSMGIIPVGTGNALARELGIPLEIGPACDLLLESQQSRSLDVLKVGSDYFILSVSVGLSAMTMAETARAEKRRLGRLAYILNGIRLLFSDSLWPFWITVDGRPTRIRASELLAANAGIIGIRPIRWGAQVKLDDGIIDLCFARIDSIAGFFSLLGGLVLGCQDQVEEVACIPARKKIEIRSRRRMPVQGDGEHIGFTPVQIEVVPGALKINAPSLLDNSSNPTV